MKAVFYLQKEAKSSKPLFQQIDSDKMLEMEVPSRDVEESEHLPTLFTPAHIPHMVFLSRDNVLLSPLSFGPAHMFPHFNRDTNIICPKEEYTLLFKSVGLVRF